MLFIPLLAIAVGSAALITWLVLAPRLRRLSDGRADRYIESFETDRERDVRARKMIAGHSQQEKDDWDRRLKED
jgi:hypothetical protein